MCRFQIHPLPFLIGFVIGFVGYLVIKKITYYYHDKKLKWAYDKIDQDQETIEKLKLICRKLEDELSRYMDSKAILLIERGIKKYYNENKDKFK